MNESPAPLQPLPVAIDAYFFPEVAVKANPAFDPGKPADVLRMHVTVSADEQPEEGKITARARIRSGEEGNIPYLVDVEAFGTFSPGPGVTASTPAVLPAIAQVLIGGAREMIAMITARGPWPPAMLAIVDLRQGSKP